MSDVEIRKPFVEYPDNSVIVFTEPSLTKQSFAAECDYNKVMAKWQATGLIPNLNSRTPVYEDVSGFVDFADALSTVKAAEDSFAALPSDVRYRFGNDPAALIAFLNDPSNKAEAAKLGLLRDGSGVINNPGDGAPIKAAGDGAGVVGNPEPAKQAASPGA